MIKLYTNRELSEKLGISLAKWKRWSREFLPPDPLGGMQSGFARQYYFRDAFHVMLGGHLVGDLHFSVYDARRIIEVLKDWLIEHGFYKDPGQLSEKKSTEPLIKKYIIFIQHMNWFGKKQIEFTFRIRGIIFDKLVENNDMNAREERYIETIICSVDKQSGEAEVVNEKILNITALYADFIKKLGYP